MALCVDPAATLDDLREAVTTLEEVEQNMRRVFGRAHPLTGRDWGRPAKSASRRSPPRVRVGVPPSRAGAMAPPPRG